MKTLTPDRTEMISGVLVAFVGNEAWVADEAAALRLLNGARARVTIAWRDAKTEDDSIRYAIQPGSLPYPSGRYSAVREYFCVGCGDHKEGDRFSEEFMDVCCGCVGEFAGKWEAWSGAARLPQAA